jgi:hypothetical protein
MRFEVGIRLADNAGRFRFTYDKLVKHLSYSEPLWEGA